MATIVNIHEAKTHLSRLVQRVADGEDIIVARAGVPVARLVPYAPERKPRVPGAWKGKVWIADDFDDPLSDEDLAPFYDGDIDPPG